MSYPFKTLGKAPKSHVLLSPAAFPAGPFFKNIIKARRN
jgi:hypothetical protein